MLDRLESGALADRLVLWIEESREHGVDEEELARRAGTAAGAVRAALAPPLAERRVHALRRSPDRYASECGAGPSGRRSRPRSSRGSRPRVRERSACPARLS